ncbi:CMRF35-like molecule 5 isoform X2 [Pygocentrus nattereri]|uniref:CMRF35-like molecule 5 isoform X2 n=1 Tax=Pygocentrus nattereri TaxID=42514 RepID=UPI0008144100|nr:CMRF35-like molecule 5 isoform X2 [Pygocentrus nattereri]
MNVFVILTLYLISDPCCTGKKTLTGHPGKTVTISCSYPEEFTKDSEESEESTKFFEKLDGQNFTEVIRTTETRKGRFSISDDRRSKVLRLSISDMREDDGGVYLCGVERGDYEAFFTEIQLQVTAPNSSVFTILFSCVALLLIGGSALIIYTVMRKKRRGSTPSFSKMELKDSKEVTPVEIEHTRCVSTSDTGVDANNSNKDICSTIQPPKDEGLTYATVIFPDFPNNTPVTNSREDLATEYASVKHHTGLE